MKKYNQLPVSDPLLFDIFSRSLAVHTVPEPHNFGSMTTPLISVEGVDTQFALFTPRQVDPLDVMPDPYEGIEGEEQFLPPYSPSITVPTHGLYVKRSELLRTVDVGDGARSNRVSREGFEMLKLLVPKYVETIATVQQDYALADAS